MPSVIAGANWERLQWGLTYLVAARRAERSCLPLAVPSTSSRGRGRLAVALASAVL